MIKILKESIYNRIMFAIFLIIIFCNLFSLLSLYDRISALSNSLITFISIPITIIITVYPWFKANNRENSLEISQDYENKCFVGLINFNDIERNKSRLLKRNQHKKNIVKKIDEIFALNYSAKGLILTGESGAGKSILLRFVMDELLEKGYSAHIVNTYNDSGEFPKPDKNAKNIFIFDQFERAFDFTTIENWIDEFKGDFKNCVFVFSFPQKFLTGFYNKIMQKNIEFNLQSYVLCLNKEDEHEYLKKITKITGLEDKIILNMWENADFEENKYFTDERTTSLACLLERELYNVKKGNAPLIEMEFLGEMVEQYIGSEIEITDSNFIELFFDEWVDKFYNKETAYAILTLFTQFEAYSLEDIKYITFENGKKFNSKLSGEIFYLLKTNSFLTHKLGGKEIDTTASNCLFAPRHEYVSRAIQKYLAAKEIPLGIKCYTEHYRINSKFILYKKNIKKRYDDFTKKHTALNASLCIMLAMLLFINFMGVFTKDISVDLIWHRLFITAVSFPSIFYIYNYCDKIMCVKGRIGAFFTGFVGFSMIVASYIFPNWWGILLGSEIIVFSLCILLSMAIGTIKEAKANLAKDFVVFLFIGVTVVTLGIVFLLFFNSVKEISWQCSLLKYSYYVLFIIYSIMSDINHIKYSYIYSKIGYLNMFLV